MTEQNKNIEQRDAAGLPERKKAGSPINFGKLACVLVLALASLILIAGVMFMTARFIPRGTPVGVYRARAWMDMENASRPQCPH